MFRIVLSHCRKGYREAVLRQSTESFIRALENAFWHYGGVSRALAIDNLRAAVQKADWCDPELNPKVEAFCRHYGTVILPARPYMPRHKGKVERGIGCVKGNALRGRTFGTLFTMCLLLCDVRHRRPWCAGPGSCPCGAIRSCSRKTRPWWAS